MSQIKYLLDEHVNPHYKHGLQRRRPEIIVWCIGDPGAPDKSTLDPDILIWCEERDFILVTNNRSSMPVHLRDHLASGRHCPGIFVINMRLSMGAIIDELELIWQGSELAEYRDLIRHLPIS